MPKARWDVRPGTIRVKFGAPIDPKPFEGDREALARALRDQIIDLHREIGGLGGDKANAIDRERSHVTVRPRVEPRVNPSIGQDMCEVSPLRRADPVERPADIEAA